MARNRNLIRTMTPGAAVGKEYLVKFAEYTTPSEVRPQAKLHLYVKDVDMFKAANFENRGQVVSRISDCAGKIMECLDPLVTAIEAEEKDLNGSFGKTSEFTCDDLNNTRRQVRVLFMDLMNSVASIIMMMNASLENSGFYFDCPADSDGFLGDRDDVHERVSPESTIAATSPEDPEVANLEARAKNAEEQRDDARDQVRTLQSQLSDRDRELADERRNAADLRRQLEQRTGPGPSNAATGEVYSTEPGTEAPTNRPRRPRRG